jgi:hypothetical protein
MLNLIRKLFLVPARGTAMRRAALKRAAVPLPPPEAACRAPTPDWELGLIPHAQRWLQRLPPEQRPTRLVLAFPRIANRLSLLWPSASLIDGYFDDLLTDKRGGRRGFPEDIGEEIARLQDYRLQSGDLADTFFGEPDPVAGHGVNAGGVQEQTTPGFLRRL